jgi:hypothetical protein
LAPSPMANVIALTDFFTNSTISAFCNGETLQTKICFYYHTQWYKNKIRYLLSSFSQL